MGVERTCEHLKFISGLAVVFKLLLSPYSYIVTILPPFYVFCYLATRHGRYEFSDQGPNSSHRLALEGKAPAVGRQGRPRSRF